MRASKLGSNALLLPLGLVLGVVNSGRSHAQEMRTFIIAATAGYGVEDCLGEGNECGRVVADAWCEAHGGGAALKFGRSGDDTDAVANVSSSVRRPYFITCGD